MTAVQLRHLCEDGSVESCHVQYTHFENLAEVFFSSLSLPNFNATDKYAHLLSVIPVFVTAVNCLRWGCIPHSAIPVLWTEENLHTSFAKEFFSWISG